MHICDCSQFRMNAAFLFLLFFVCVLIYVSPSEDCVDNLTLMTLSKEANQRKPEQFCGVLQSHRVKKLRTAKLMYAALSSSSLHSLIGPRLWRKT